MKNFEDLVFSTHSSLEITSTELVFENGFGVHVMLEETGNYEFDVIYVDEGGTDVIYATSVASETLCGLTKERVSEYIQKVQELPHISVLFPDYLNEGA